MAISKRVSELENRVVSDWPKGETYLGIEDAAETEAEMQLHERAREIVDVSKDAEILNGPERIIVEKSLNLLEIRLMQLIVKAYEAWYPKIDRGTLWQRVMWFIHNLKRQGLVCRVIDEQWNSNRNEEAEDFDDFKWWDMVDAKVKEQYPILPFSEESWKQVEEIHEEVECEVVRKFCENHPEELDKLKDRLKGTEVE